MKRLPWNCPMCHPGYREAIEGGAVANVAELKMCEYHTKLLADAKQSFRDFAANPSVTWTHEEEE